MKNRVLQFAIVAALMATPTVAFAQGIPTPEQKEEAYQDAFAKGLEFIRAKRYEMAIRAFQFCVNTEPERPTAYYNLACVYSLMGEKAKALNWLEQSLKRGFKGFAHMGRDTDLDNIREEPGYKTIVEDHKRRLLAKATSRVIAPKSLRGPALTLVWLHGDGERPARYERELGELAERLGIVVLLPQAEEEFRDGFRWGQTAETLVLSQLASLQTKLKVDKGAVIIGGFSTGGFRAMQIALQRPDIFRGFVSLSGYYDPDQMRELLPKAKESGLRGFLSSGKEDGLNDNVRGGRDALVAAGIPVVFQRPEGGHKLPSDLNGTLEVALRFVTKDRNPEPRHPRGL